jgi:hypothetical protein
MINLNVSNQKVIVKPDYQPYILTGNTYYSFVGFGGTHVYETINGNHVLVEVFSAPPTGTTIQFVDILGNATDNVSLANQLNLKLNKTIFSGYTGTTVPNTYATIVNFNAHTGNTGIHRTSGQTQTQINNSLLDYYTTGQTNIFLNSKLNKTTFSYYTGTTAPNTYLGINALNGYWNSGQTSTFVTTRGYLTSSALLPYWTSAQTSTFVTTRGYVTASIINNIWNSGQTISYINGRNFLTSANLNGYWTSAQTTNYLSTRYWTSGQTSTFVTTRGYITSSALLPYWTSAQTQSHINSALLPYWTSAQTSTFVTTRGYLTSSALNGYWNSGQTQSHINSALLPYWTSAQTSTFVTTRGYVTASIVNGYWNSGQTISYINGRNFLTSANLNGYWTSAQTTGYLNTRYWTSGQTSSYIAGKNYVTASIINNIWNSGQTISYINGRNFLTSANLNGYWTSAQTESHINSSLLPYWTSAQTSTFVTTRGYLTSSALNGYWNSGQTINYVQSQISGITSTSAWSGITGNPTGSTSLMNLLGDYVDYTTYNFNNNILSQQLISIDNQLTWLSGHTGGTGGGTWGTITGSLSAQTDLQNALNLKLATSVFATYTGTTAPAAFASKSFLSTYTGTTAPAAFASKSFLSTYIGTTAPAAFASKSFLSTYTGTTAPAAFASKSFLSTYTGTTVPNTYATKANAITGSTSAGGTYTQVAANTANKVSIKGLAVSGLVSITSGSSYNTIVGNADSTKANLVSPKFTGVPSGTTAAVNTNTVQLATTAFVLAQASKVNPLVDGTAASGTSYYYSRQDHVHPSDTTKAPLASPTFTGVVTIPTPFTLGAVSVKTTGTELNYVTGATSNIQTQINARALQTAINTYTGTTAPSTYYNKTQINSYTGATNTAIGNRLLTTIYSTYTGTTAPATYQTKSSITTYTGTTAPASYAPKHPTISGVTANATLSATHDGYILQVNGAYTITLPNSMVAGYQVTIINIGTSTVTLAASTTLNSKNTAKKLATQYGAATAYHSGSNVWYAFGDLTV